MAPVESEYARRANRRGDGRHATARVPANGDVGRVPCGRAEWPTEGRRTSGAGADGWGDRERQDEVDPFGIEAAAADDVGRPVNRGRGDVADGKDVRRKDRGRAAVPQAIAGVRRRVMRRSVRRRVGLLADGRRSRRQPMTGMGIMQSLRSAGRGCRRRRRAGRGGRLRVRAMSARWARQRHGAGGDDAAPHQRHNGVQQSGHATSRHGASHDGYVHADRARCQDGSGRRLVRIRRPWCRYFRYTC